jgi:hypothetical protein
MEVVRLNELRLKNCGVPLKESLASLHPILSDKKTTCTLIFGHIPSVLRHTYSLTDERVGSDTKIRITLTLSNVNELVKEGAPHGIFRDFRHQFFVEEDRSLTTNEESDRIPKAGLLHCVKGVPSSGRRRKSTWNAGASLAINHISASQLSSGDKPKLNLIEIDGPTRSHLNGGSQEFNLRENFSHRGRSCF